MNYQKLIIVGNATGTPLSQKSRKGDLTFTTFGVAVSEYKDKTIFFSVTVFGTLGEMANRLVTKGRQVLVEGRIEISKNNRFNVIADKFQVGPSVKASSSDF